MTLQDTPIQLKLMRVILLTSGAVLLLTCAAFFTYEFFTFRESTVSQLRTLGEIIAINSTAALAFDDPDDASETLNALRVEKHIVSACLYDKEGKIFSHYPDSLREDQFPAKPSATSEYHFAQAHLEGFEPVMQNERQLGTLYLKSDLKAISNRFQQYAVIASLVILISFVFAYFLSKRLQQSISKPILELAETASIISTQHDYSVRARKSGDDELGILTDAFNHMLQQIEAQNAEITSFNSNLEEKVRVRTEELESAKNEIEAINKKLIKSNHDLEQFAYIASHDLQEPLRKIQAFSELIGRNLDNGELSRRYLEKVISSARRMTDLIISVLHYSRLSKADEPFEEVDLNEIVENIKTDFELAIQEKNAVVNTDILPAVKGIPLQLNQLFYNLIGNALKFSEKAPVINISTRELSGKEVAEVVPDHEESSPYIELKIQDNGIGFEQHFAEQIFTIFQRLHSKQDYSGTGIGLALCKKIVENHNGAIRAESRPGEGATFYIYLPVLEK